jgi:SAM-dependent methyltransferase
MYDVTKNTSTNPGPLVRGRQLSQAFVARADGLCGISLWVATYHKRIDSVAKLRVQDDAGVLVREVSVGTSAMDDNTWHRFAFDPVPACKGRAFSFLLETDGEGEAITVWTNDRISAVHRENGAAADAAICFRSHYVRDSHRLTDALMPAWVARSAAPTAASAETLHEIVRYCVARKGYFFLRLAHLLHALDVTNDVTRVLSIGCGMGYHEAYLAARFAQLRVDAADMKLPEDEWRLPNLRFQHLDIMNPTGGMNYDLVFSIECLEHIEDYRTAFRNMAAKVAPGRYFYLSVPFASQDEQRDESARRTAWEVAEHYTPGFDFATLQEYFGDAGFTILAARNMFYCALAHPLNALMKHMDARDIENGLADIVKLFLLDLRDDRVATSREAEGVWVLARRNET